MTAPRPVVVDFETEAIAPRPAYPPKPVGVAIAAPGKAPRYYAWGHPTGNNCTAAQGKAALAAVWKRPLLFHNAKFDVDVAVTHLGLPMPSWDLIHDTLYLLFLDDPHALSLSLKTASERLLGMPPEEQDAVKEWLLANGIIKSMKQKDAGAYIAKAPGGLVGEYAVGDVVRTDKLFQLLHAKVCGAGMEQAYDRERRLMPILLQNERDGMRVDVAGLERDIKAFTAAQEKADAWLRKRLEAPTMNLDADEEVASALDKLDLITEWRLTPKRKEKSVSKKYLTPDKFKDTQVASVLGYRNRLGTVLSMSMRPWLEQALAGHGYITTEWNQVRQEHGNDGKRGTRTGRLSCSRFQNITKDFADKDDGYVHPKFLKVPELPLVRKYILPDEGEVFYHRDLSQQELRLLGHFEDGKLCAAYNADPKLDVHTYVGELIESIMGLKLGRRVVKQMNFGKVYGMGAPGLMEKLKCSREEAEQFIAAHRKALPDVRALENDIKYKARMNEPIRTWGGRLYYCEAPKLIKGIMRSFEYKLLNYLIQASAADWTKEACIRYDSMRKHGRFLVTVHDEINISVPERHLKSEAKILKEAMENMPLDVPMLSDAKVGPSWGELKKVEE